MSGLAAKTHQAGGLRRDNKKGKGGGRFASSAIKGKKGAGGGRFQPRRGQSEMITTAANNLKKSSLDANTVNTGEAIEGEDEAEGAENE